MGLRFRKSIKVAPGVKLNVGKKSAGISVGTKGARYSVNSSGRRTTTVGAPGTGLSYTKSHTKSKEKTHNVENFRELVESLPDDFNEQELFNEYNTHESAEKIKKNASKLQWMGPLAFIILAVAFAICAMIPGTIICLIVAYFFRKWAKSDIKKAETYLSQESETEDTTE